MTVHTNLVHRTPQRPSCLPVAQRDPLTGLLTRATMIAAINNTVARPPGEAAQGYVALDIDHLARLNQNFGLEFGDRVLRAAGTFLARRVPNLIAVGRMSGGGFGLLLGCMGQESLQFQTEKLVQSLGTELLQLDRRALITASAGAVLLSRSITSAGRAVSQAERALGEAKNNGRNQAVLSGNTSAACNPGIAKGRQLQEALSQNRLRLAYQPVVNAATSNPAFHECLLRLDDGSGHLTPAAHLVPVAEDVGLIRAIDRWVLDRVVSELTAYRSAHLALNVSAFSISNTGWMERLESLSRLHPGIAERLIVEITETTAMRDIGLAIAFAERIRRTGAKLALDDFGAGYTSFAHLRDFPIDMVKIDGRFTQNLDADPQNRLLLGALLQLPKGFGLATVAECAETPEDAHALAAAGATYIQGYHFGRPSPLRQPTSATGFAAML